MSKFDTPENHLAVSTWGVCYDTHCSSVDIGYFIEHTGIDVIRASSIVLDSHAKRRTMLRLEGPGSNAEDIVYILTKDDKIMKMGSTRGTWESRWGSYLCGHFVPQRTNTKGKNYPGKMSVTNAQVYHCILKDLMEHDSKWEVYIWEIPKMKVTREILGETVEMVPQWCHIYESVIIKKYKDMVGNIPAMCVKSDPKYR